MHRADHCESCGQPFAYITQPIQRFGLAVDVGQALVAFQGNPIHFSAKEMEILALLVRWGRVSHELLVAQICDKDQGAGLVGVMVFNIRRKLSKHTGDSLRVRSVHGYGYELIAR